MLRTRQTLADMEALETSRAARLVLRPRTTTTYDGEGKVASTTEELRPVEGSGESGVMDFITIVAELVTAWSYPEEVTPENVRRVISVDDVTTLREHMVVARPNGSRPSSTGTTPRTKAAASRRRSGVSGR